MTLSNIRSYGKTYFVSKTCLFNAYAARKLEVGAENVTPELNVFQFDESEIQVRY